MSWTNAVVTEAGLALQAKLVDGQTLGFLRVAAGTGTVDPSVLANQTALANEKQTLTFQPPNVLDGAKIKVPVMLNNIGLETGYMMQQLGFFANDPDNGEILYAIVQDEVGDAVPSQTESPGFVIEWAFVFQFGNASEVTVTLDPVGLVSIGMVGAPNGVAGLDETGKVPESQLPELDFDPSGSAAAVQANLTAHTANKSNPHGVTAAQVGAFTKAQTLTAETAALFGLGADATPNSVLAQIKTLLNQCNAAADTKTMSELKSYVGTGTYGASNPMSLSFSFTPFIVMCVGYKMTGDSYNTYVATFDQGSIPQIVVSALTTSYVQGRGLCWDSSALQYAYGKRSADSKTIYWYNTYGSGGGAYQFNSNGYTYYFLAIGRK